MEDQTSAPWRVVPRPDPDPSPPPLEADFEDAVEDHHEFWGARTRAGHQIRASKNHSPSSVTNDWRLQLSATWLSGRDSKTFHLQEFPPHLLPFFAYKDVAIYVSEGSDNSIALFDTIYREWYPTRDRAVFNNGLLKGCGAPFLSSTMRLSFEDQTARQPPALLDFLVRWHLGLVRRLQDLVHDFVFLADSHSYARLLVRPGLTQEQLQNLPTERRRLIVYEPVIRRTFGECFVWVEKGWQDKGVKLVVLGEDMQHRILSGEDAGLMRNVELEETARQAFSSGPEPGETAGSERDDDIKVLGHVRMWRGSLEHVMRVVLAGDDARKRGLREYNPVLDEWLGEGVNVGKEIVPKNRCT